jgi:hypothetical protein
MKVKILCFGVILGVFGVPATDASVARVDFVSGTTATINRGSGAVQLMKGDVINIGDVIHTNSSRVQFSDTGGYGSIVRMGVNAVAEFKTPPSPLLSMVPGLTFSAHFQAGEVYKTGGCDGKYRTSCYIGCGLLSSAVFLRPGSGPNEDLYYALKENLLVYDYQPTTSTDPNDWTQILSLNLGEMGSLTFNPDTGFHTASEPQPIGTSDLDYITGQYVNNALWSEGGYPTASEWGLIIMAGMLLTAGAIVIARRKRVAA